MRHVILVRSADDRHLKISTDKTGRHQIVTLASKRGARRTKFGWRTLVSQCFWFRGHLKSSFRVVQIPHISRRNPGTRLVMICFAFIFVRDRNRFIGGESKKKKDFGCKYIFSPIIPSSHGIIDRMMGVSKCLLAAVLIPSPNEAGSLACCCCWRRSLRGAIGA